MAEEVAVVVCSVVVPEPDVVLSLLVVCEDVVCEDVVCEEVVVPADVLRVESPPLEAGLLEPEDEPEDESADEDDPPDPDEVGSPAPDDGPADEDEPPEPDCDEEGEDSDDLAAGADPDGGGALVVAAAGAVVGATMSTDASAIEILPCPPHGPDGKGPRASRAA